MSGHGHELELEPLFPELESYQLALGILGVLICAGIDYPLMLHKMPGTHSLAQTNAGGDAHGHGGGH